MQTNIPDPDYTTSKMNRATNRSVGAVCFHATNFAWALIISLFVVCLFSMKNAQAQSADVQPPSITLEEINDGLAGEMQTFTATVVDDQKLASVILFHRLAGDESYLSTEMLPVANSDIHTASVSITTDDPRDIEYYLSLIHI